MRYERLKHQSANPDHRGCIARRAIALCPLMDQFLHPDAPSGARRGIALGGRSALVD